MKNELPRLRDDPSFLADTGCDLRTEPDTLDNPDLAALRARVLASLAPPVESPWPRRIAVGAASVLVVVAALWFWPRSEPPTQPRDVAPPLAEAAPLPQHAAAPRAVEVSPEAPPLAPRSEPRGGGARGPQATLPAESQAPPSPALPPRAAESAPAHVGADNDMAEQLAAFELAETALAEGDPARASTLYRRALDRWPAGHFAPESGLGMLRAAVASGDSAEAERLSAKLLADPALATRRVAILTARAESLAVLGRCPEATALAADLDRPTQKQVRESCR